MIQTANSKQQTANSKQQTANSKQQTANSSVAVITTTIGRKTLEKTIISIQEQTYSCKHYVFVDGKEHWDKVKDLENKYPNVIFTFLPMNTGGRNNIGNGAIHAIVPYLIQEDIICFLDDDNWYDNNHIECLVNFIDQHQLDYAYSLRRLYDSQYQYICDDNVESLGFWRIPITRTIDTNGTSFVFSLEKTGHLVDTNTYALTREISFKLSQAWYSGLGNDRAVFNTLLELKARGGCTAKRTVNYKFNPQIDFSEKAKQYAHTNEAIDAFSLFIKSISNELAQGEMAWKTPTLWINGELIPVSEKL